MALADIARLRRDLPRLGEIIRVFARFGFGDWIDRLSLQEHIPFVRRLLARRRAAVVDKAMTTEKRLAAAFQELGATFVKLGQVLSSRPDLVGESFADEFKQLRDRVEPFDAAVARRIVEEDLKAPASKVFRSFERTPAGCGSIAQVHRAVLPDGTPVMVKIRRPGIEAAVLSDIRILRFIARIAESQIPEFRPTQIVEEFDRVIREELDFMVEASNTASFQQAFENVAGVRSPAVFWDLTTPAVLTIERLEGVSIGDIEELERRGHDRRRLARTLADCFLSQYFGTGTFHADPHPGNLLVADDGTIGLLDFGMVGHLSAGLRERLTTILIAAVAGDIDFIAEAATELGATGEVFAPAPFRRDLSALYHKYRGMPLGRMDTRRLFRDLTRLARQNDLVLPRDLVLLGKSIATLSSVARALDPEYDVLGSVAPKTEDLIKDKLSPRRLVKEAGLNALALLQMLRTVPRDARSILRKLETGQLQVGFRHRGIERALTELDRASNRLAISIYIAALLVASSLMMKVDFFQFRGISIPGVLGYGLASLLSLLLAWGILRSGRL